MPKLTIELTDIEYEALNQHASKMRRKVRDQAMFIIASHLESTGDLSRAAQKAHEAEQDKKYADATA